MAKIKKSCNQLIKDFENFFRIYKKRGCFYFKNNLMKLLEIFKNIHLKIYL